MRVRFHLDEHIPFGVGAGLRRRGIDVTCAAEVGLVGVGDKEQLSFAAQSGGVLVTQDADLLRLHKAGVAHARCSASRSELQKSRDLRLNPKPHGFNEFAV